MNTVHIEIKAHSSVAEQILLQVIVPNHLWPTHNPDDEDDDAVVVRELDGCEA